MAVGQKSKPITSGRKKGGTETTRRHRFKSFSQRIQNLKIEPIRRARRHDYDDGGTSHFQTALTKWRDSNLSTNYVSFSARVDPLCESLPQILHNQNRIVDLLVEYMGKLDELSLQPLLDLVAQLAHDLGIRFEVHFEKLLIAVTTVAARHEDIEAIEWSFSCLAWLFKYLSRLLVSDLRPLYDWMAPLLGKQPQKHYVPTFAAEALSFLLRKAGQLYGSNKDPLRNIVRHILTDVNAFQPGSSAATRYQHGVMTLFAESIKGVQYGIHSSAENIFQELILETLQLIQLGLVHTDEAVPPVQTVLCGTIINVIHATTVDTFAPLLETTVKSLQLNDETPDTHLYLHTQLILVVCGVRKGSRVSDWSSLVLQVNALREHVQQSSRSKARSPKLLSDILSCLAVVLHGCPLDVALPYVRRLDFLTATPWLDYFLPFCTILSKLNYDRFTLLALPHLQRFIVQNWEEQGDRLCIILPRLANPEALSRAIRCPSEWQSATCDLANAISSRKGVSNDDVLKCNSRLVLAERLPFEEKQRKVLTEKLMDIVSNTFSSKTTQDETLRRFYLGKAFEFATTQNPEASAGLLWDHIEQATSQLTGLTTFWTAVRLYIQRNRITFDDIHAHSILLKNLCRCLSSPSHELRLTALEILLSIVGGNSECLDHAIAIETSPLDLANARNISLRIRNLATAYKKSTTDEWTSRAIPSFCFGILHLKLSQAWDDSVNTIREICTTTEGEIAVSALAFDWLNPSVFSVDALSTEVSVLDQDVSSIKATSNFECFNHLQLQQRIKNYHRLTAEVDHELSILFEGSNTISELQNAFCRTQALKVLNGIPEFAEKRNRLLVPVLLNWAGQSDSPDGRPTTTTDADSVTLKWDRRDQKSLLSLFAQFNNPRVLYESEKVHSAFLSLLTNADVEVQKSALKALLAWKDLQITRYEEDLFKLLDETTFRDQLSVFLGVEEDDNAIQVSDHDHVMPIILRILYGKVVLREGSASGKQGQKARRKAVFTLLSRTIDVSSGQKDFADFLTIALGKLDGISIIDGNGLRKDVYDQLRQVADPRKLYGLLNMLEDMLETLRTKINPFLSRIVDPLLFCLIFAYQSTPEAEGPGDLDFEATETPNSNEGLLKSMRQVAQRCLNLAFANGENFAWGPYAAVVNKEMVLPRLEKLPVENAHSVSGLLRLFSTWASYPPLATFLAYPPTGVTILQQVGECLIEPSAQADVKLFIVNEIIRQLLQTASMKGDMSIESQEARQCVKVLVLEPQISMLLTCLGEVIRASPKKDALDATILCVAELAPFVHSSSDAVKMIRISAALLKEPARKVSPKTKHNLLLTLHSLVPLCDSHSQYAEEGLYDVICSLFEYFRDRDNRVLLSTVLEQITADTEIHDVALLCQDLNSYDPTRLDEPDFERRSGAYRKISESNFVSSGLQQWKPIVYNALFHVNDVENLSVRLDSSSALRRFIDAGSQKTGPEQVQFLDFIQQAVIPSLQKGIKQTPELVRSEHLAVLAHTVSSFPDWPTTSDMYALLAGNDSEASFFNNVLHIQQHRRLRALRRLANEASSLSSGSISKIFLPLLDHFVFDPAEDETSHNLANEASNTMTALVQGLEWPQYRAVFTRYVDSLTSKPGLEKPIIKLIGAVTDGLTQACIQAKSFADGVTKEQVVGDSEQPEPMDIDLPPPKMSRTLPKGEIVSRDLTNGPISKLTQYIHNKDETDINLRIPVAVAVVKLLKVLPDEEFYARLPAVLLDICQILRSRSQDARDMTRKTLAEISSLIGPHCFSFLLKEMRTALPRGYQLHVLSFTMHSILVVMTEKLKPGDLDYCLPQIVDVIMDGIFGVTGQEKDAEEYISKMKEVKSQKNFDSMELLAKTTSLYHLIDLIRPIKNLLLEKLDFTMARKIDDLLRRIETGLAQNEVSKQQGILQFCFDVVREAANSESNQTNGVKEEKDRKTKRYLITMKGARHNHSKGAITSQMHKLARFSLELLRLVMKRYDHLHTPENLAGFLPVIGDSLLSGHEEVQLAAMKLLTRIIRVPLKQIDENGPVYVSTAYNIVKAAPNTSTELAQAALKLISVIIRDREALAVEQIKETQLSFLLLRLKDDLRQPDRQGVAFNFIRAILGRKIVIPEMYDIMDSEVSHIMITNQTGAIRDHARGVFVQFFTNYPQSKDRFKKQMGRLVKNLSYEHSEGRISVMEALNDILTNKNVNSELLSGVLMSCFLGLIMVVANDTSRDCKDMAKVLIKRVFEKADESTSKDLVSQLKLYLDNGKSPIRSLGVQLYSLYIEANENNTGEVSFFLGRLANNLDLGLEDSKDGNWEMLFRSLRALIQLAAAIPTRIFSSKTAVLWSSVASCLTYPHTWVKESAAQALQQYLTDFARANKDSGLAKVPLHGSNGLLLDANTMFRIAKGSLNVLRTQDPREELALLAIRNLLFLGKAFVANGLPWPTARSNGAAEEDDKDNDEDASSSASEDEESEPPPATSHLLNSLAVILRRPLPAGSPANLPSLVAKTHALTLAASLVTLFSLDILTPSLPALLRPLLVLISDKTTHPSYPNQDLWTTTYKKYIENSAELLSSLREKVGQEQYSVLIRKVEKVIKNESEKRGVKRKMERVREPEKEEERKRRRREKQKVAKREKGQFRRKRNGQE